MLKTGFTMCQVGDANDDTKDLAMSSLHVNIQHVHAFFVAVSATTALCLQRAAIILRQAKGSQAVMKGIYIPLMMRAIQESEDQHCQCASHTATHRSPVHWLKFPCTHHPQVMHSRPRSAAHSTVSKSKLNMVLVRHASTGGSPPIGRISRGTVAPGETPLPPTTVR